MGRKIIHTAYNTELFIAHSRKFSLFAIIISISACLYVCMNASRVRKKKNKTARAKVGGM